MSPKNIHYVFEEISFSEVLCYPLQLYPHIVAQLTTLILFTIVILNEIEIVE